MGVYTATKKELGSKFPSSQRNLGEKVEAVFSTWSSGMYTAFIETWYPSSKLLRQCPDNKTSYEVPRAHNQIISPSIFVSLSVVRTRKRSDRSFQVLNSQVFVCRLQVSNTWFRHLSVIGRMHVIDLHYIVLRHTVTN